MIKPLKDAGNISHISRPSTPPPAYTPPDPALPPYPGKSSTRPSVGMPNVKPRPSAMAGTQSSMPAKNPNALNLLKIRLKPSKDSAPENTDLPTRNLSYMNLAAGVGDLKNLSIDDIPDMMVRINVNDPAAVNAKPGSKEELLLQKMTLTAYSGLSEAREKTNEFIRDFDRRLDKPLTKETREAFQQECMEVLNEHQSAIKQSVDDEWSMQKLRDSNRRDYNTKFAVNLALKSTKLGVSAATAATVVLSPVSVAASAMSALSLAKLIYKFSQDRDAALKAMVKGDEALNKRLRADLADGGKLATGRQATNELLVSVPIPMINKLTGPTIKKQQDAVSDFLAKSGRLDKEVRKYYEKSIKDLKKIEEAEYAKMAAAESGQTLPKAHRDLDLEKMRGKINARLEMLTPLMEKIDADNATYKDYQNRCEEYRNDYLPPHIGEASDAVEKIGLCAIGAKTLLKAAELAVTVAV